MRTDGHITATVDVGIMDSHFKTALSSSIVRKQIVAITGIGLVLFIIGHLAGNLLLFLGPDAFNGYAEKLASLGAGLWAVRIGLIVFFVLHVYFTITLWHENRAARRERYEVEQAKGDQTFTRRYMVLTGLLVFAFLFFHLKDFTFGDHDGPASIMGEQSLGLFGLVWNSFQSFPRTLFYVAAVCCVGMHLSHGVQSLFQTLGLHHDRYSPLINKASVVLGVLVAAGFSFIPLAVLLLGTP